MVKVDLVILYMEITMPEIQLTFGSMYNLIPLTMMNTNHHHWYKLPRSSARNKLKNLVYAGRHHDLSMFTSKPTQSSTFLDIDTLIRKLINKCFGV